MKSIVFFFLILSLPALAEQRPPLSEQDAAGMREVMGVRDLGSDSDSASFAFREEGSFLVSKKAFPSRPAAVAFCASKPGYQLAQGMLPAVLIMMGLPFPELQKQMIVSTPVLGRNEDRTGVVTWISVDLSKVPPEHKPSEYEKQAFEIIRGGDYLLSFTDGDGGAGGGIESTKALNERLAAAGRSPLALSAICVDAKLSEMDSGRK